MSRKEKEDFLRGKGWYENGRAPWVWTHPRYPSAHYTLEHAYELARANGRE